MEANKQPGPLDKTPARAKNAKQKKMNAVPPGNFYGTQ